MSHIFGRLALGTANFGHEYNGAKVPEDDIKRILDYCQCSGITTIDTAEAYGWDWTEAKTCFDIVVKTNAPIGATKNYHNIDCIMSHNAPHGWYVVDKQIRTGASLYEPSEIREVDERCQVLQVPYSIYDRRFSRIIDSCEFEIHVRSIFLRGKILEAGFTPVQCIAFCLMNPNIDKVILGADSYEQFKNNLKPFHRWNTAEKHDINLLDCRRWETE